MKKLNQIVEWAISARDVDGKPIEWQLMVSLPEIPARCVATVWKNGTWHTWDREGTGGGNDVEDSPKQARVEAAASAIEQGFI